MLNDSPRARAVLDRLAPAGTPFLQALVGRMIGGALPRTTLLAVCPNSEAVTRAAVRVGHAAGVPVLFAATLNQVDTDGGYTGWSPDAFVRFVAEEAARVGADTPLLPCLDHGGPWLKDAHAGLSLDATTAAVRRSIEACLDAGYALLHLDPTVDRALPRDAPVPVERVVSRTLDLVAHAEAYRTRRGLPAVAYEVGTEEVHGGLADAAVFDRFLHDLDAELRTRGLAHAWPCFVVGKVGTDLHTSTFDPAVARALTAAVRPYGALLKGHYTDHVANPEAYPRAGVGGANVGPEFTAVEFAALEELAALERSLGHDSGLLEALTAAVDRSGRWAKWLRPEEAGCALGALPPERHGWLVRTGARYVWTDPDVVDARARLYRNLEGTRDADAFVLSRIEAAILRYVRAFGLAGLNERLLALPPAPRPAAASRKRGAPPTLEAFVLAHEGEAPGPNASFARLMGAVAAAATTIDRHVRRAGLTGLHGDTGTVNVQDEVQTKLDLLAHQVLVRALRRSGEVGLVGSEELAEPIPLLAGGCPGRYVVLFDPLDGSSNLDANAAVGTIFSVYRVADGHAGPVTLASALRSGRHQVAAGYVVYGTATLLVYTAGHGVNGFTLDPSAGGFVLSHPGIRMPATGRICSFNEANRSAWPPGLRAYVAWAREEAPGAEPPRPYTSRYIASFAADLHRNLLHGGLYLYPADRRSARGKLRLMYEANPMAFILEQAGGRAETGHGPILDVVPEGLHDRTPVIMGSAAMVEDAVGFLAGARG